MSRIGCLVLVVLSICHGLAHAQEMVLGTDGIHPHSNAEGTGFDDRIVREAFQRLGRTVRIERLPSERALINANDGVDDGTFSRIRGLDALYPNLIIVPARISDFSFTAFTKRSDIRIGTWDDLEPYNVVIVNGWKFAEMNIKKKKSLHKVRHDDMLFQFLLDDRADVVVHGLYGGKLILKEKGISGIVAHYPPLGTTEMFLYMNRRHADLVPELTETLRRMDADGTRRGIIDEVLLEAGIQ